MDKRIWKYGKWLLGCMLVLLAICFEGKDAKAYTLSCSTSKYGISTNNVDSVTNSDSFTVGDTVYTNAAISTEGSYLIKSYTAEIYKDNNLYDSYSYTYTNGVRWFSWAHTINSPGSYSFRFTSTDNAGNTLTVASNFNVYDVNIVLTNNPSNKTIVVGDSATFSVGISQGTNITYQWWYNTTNDTSRGYRIIGATSPSYTLSDATESMNDRYYFCVVSNYGHQIISKAAKLTVQYAPTVSIDGPSYAYDGDQASYRVSVSGGNPTSYSYQWYYASTASGTKYAILGETGSSYDPIVTGTMSGRYYYCKVTNGNVTTWSEGILLTVKYLIQYDANGGSGAPVSQTKYHGTNIRLRSLQPYREEYRFDGWSTNKDTIETIYFSGENYTEDNSIVLYAVWSEIPKSTPTPTVKPTPTPTVKPTPTPETPPPTPTPPNIPVPHIVEFHTIDISALDLLSDPMTNYTAGLIGIDTVVYMKMERPRRATVEKISEKGTITEAKITVTLGDYEKWKETVEVIPGDKFKLQGQVTVTGKEACFVVRVGDSATSSPPPPPVESPTMSPPPPPAESPTMSPPFPPEENKIVIASYEKRNGAGSWVLTQTQEAYTGSLTVPENIYSVSKYTLRYDFNYPSEEGKNQKFLQSADGPAFTYWNTQPDGSGTSYFPGDTYSRTETLELYAQYDRTWTIAALLEEPSCKNYTFLGWFTEASGGAKIAVPFTLANDMTLYAHWKKDEGGIGELSTPTPTPTAKPTEELPLPDLGSPSPSPGKPTADPGTSAPDISYEPTAGQNPGSGTETPVNPSVSKDSTGSEDDDEDDPDDTDDSGVPDSSGSTKQIKAGKVVTISGLQYKVLKSTKKEKTVTLWNAANKNIKKAKIPNVIKIQSISFKVVQISKNAFKGCKNLQTASVGKEVRIIGNGAFSGCKKIKKITIQSKVLKKIGKGAFAGISRKAKIQVPKSKVSLYRKLMKKG